jgi:hypothetical protein
VLFVSTKVSCDTQQGITTMKVNLKDIQTRLVKRGRDAYENPELVAELLALDASIADDAFLFEDATFGGDLKSDEYTNHKNAWRNRVSSLATRYLGDAVEISVQWTDAGEMVVSFRQ